MYLVIVYVIDGLYTYFYYLIISLNYLLFCTNISKPTISTPLLGLRSLVVSCTRTVNGKVVESGKKEYRKFICKECGMESSIIKETLSTEVDLCKYFIEDINVDLCDGCVSKKI